MSFDSLRLREGEEVTSRHVQMLGTMLDQRTPLRGGNGVRITELPWGFIPKYEGGSGTFSPEAFQPIITRGTQTRVKFKMGMIAGIEPKISGVKISKDQKTGVQPSLVVAEKDFNDRREAYIYIRMTFLPDWTYDVVEMVVKRDVPVPQPYETFKLALILYKNGRSFRCLHTNVNHVAVARKTGGRAVHLFWSQF